MSYQDKLKPITTTQTPSAVGASYQQKLKPITQPETRETRIQQGLPVSSERRFAKTGQATPSFGGGIVRGALKPFARVGQSIANVGLGVKQLESQLQGQQPQGEPFETRASQSKYLGRIEPLGVREGKQLSPKEELKDVIGTGLEISSFIPVGTGANLARQVVQQPFKQAIKTTAKAFGREGAIQGGLGEAGRSLQEGDNLGQTLGRTIAGAGIGAGIGIGTGVGTQAISRALTKTPINIKQQQFDKNIRKVMQETTADLQTLEARSVRAKRGLERLATQENIEIPDLNAPIGSGANKRFDITKAKPNEFLSALESQRQKIAEIGKNSAEEASRMGRQINTLQAQRVIAESVNNGQLPRATGERFMRQIQSLQNDPLKVHEWVQNVNKNWKEDMTKSAMTKQIAEEVAKTFRQELDRNVYRGEYAEAYGDNQELKRLVIASAKRANKKVDFGDISSDAGLDAAISILTNNPLYMARTFADSVFKGIVRNIKNQSSFKSLKKAGQLAKEVGTAQMPRGGIRPQLALPPRSSNLNTQITGGKINQPLRGNVPFGLGDEPQASKILNFTKDDVKNFSETLVGKANEADSSAMEQVITEMLDLSQAGKRIRTEDGVFIAQKSTFPKWLPDDLRSMELFERVVEKIQNGATRFGVKENRLLQAMEKRANFYKGEAQKLPKKLSKEDEEFAKMVGGEQAFGAVAGLERDEEGKIRFNPEKGAIGLGVIGSLKSKAGQNLLKKVGEKAKGVYKGEKDLTTKILKDLEGKTTVSKQYILDATNRGELKQVERDLIRDIVSKEGDTVNVADFAKKVKAELLPLSVRNQKITVSQAKSKLRSMGYTIEKEMDGGASIIDKNGDFVEYDEMTPEAQRLVDRVFGTAETYDQIGGNKYENIALPDDIRGNVKNYKENIYESPIKTSAGSTHFSGQTDNYFGHTRIEDMADNKTRRVIEVQSDLYQKGNLEREIKIIPESERNGRKISEAIVDQNGVMHTPESPGYAKAKQELSKLQQYNDPTAHFRMIREEIKKASEDGKTKLQFPTGETAMKIEGLGDNTQWFKGDFWDAPATTKLKIEDLKVGEKVVQQNGDSWIITDVLGDGKFKAVPKDSGDFQVRGDKVVQAGYDEDGNEFDDVVDDYLKETFDISGKVDTNNPIYKFYEKDVAKYLNKFGGQRVIDAQGVEWIEVPIKKEWAKMPVEAFALAPLGLLQRIKQRQEQKKQEKLPSVPQEITKQFNRADFSQRIVGVENEGELARGENVYKTIGITGDLGKYQVNPQTLKDWSSAWLNKEYTPQQFLNDPEAQEKFFNNFLDVVDRLKLTPEEAAVTWHLGWGELGTGEPREVRDKKFREALQQRMQTEKAQNYLNKFNR